MSTDPTTATARIWLGSLDAERAARYYLKISEQYQRRYQITGLSVGILTVLAGALNTGSYLAESQVVAWLGLIASLFAGSAVVALLRFNDARTVAKAENAYHYFEMMRRDWRHAWTHWSDDETTIRTLEERMSGGPELNMNVNKELNERCYDDAIKAVDEEYRQYAPA